ncbi:MAG: MBL fold metallo-hydrolase [Haloarcula sp.]
MPTELVNNVYDITCTDAVGRIRAFLFDDPTPTVFDTGLADTTDALLDGIEETGVIPERLVLTHADPDHVGGFDAVVEAFDVETYVPEKASLDTEHEPDYRYQGGDEIGPFEAIYIGGHTSGSSALVDENRGILVAGDTVVGADCRGLPEGYLINPPTYFNDDAATAEANLERLLEFEFDTALVYHGSSVVGDAHKKLDAFMNFPGKGL